MRILPSRLSSLQLAILGLLLSTGAGTWSCGDGSAPASKAAGERKSRYKAVLLVASVPSASTRQPGFVERTIFTGLDHPTSIEFARDGRVFIAEKRGMIKVFDSVDASASDWRVVVDLRDEVNSYWDRGLLGIALHPEFPEQPYLYAVYTLDGRVGDNLADGTVPRYHDDCDAPSAAACVAASRLVRLTVRGNRAAVRASQRVIIENWSQPFPGHSVAALAFGPDGQLYVGGGEGAGFVSVDDGTLAGNPLGEPPGAGGALRAQVIRPPGRTPPDAIWFGGKVLRIDPDDPPSLLDPHRIDPLPAIVAKGLRNPFRMAFQPGTGDLFVGDVGWDRYEEIDVIDRSAIDRIEPGGAESSKNFGWPCYEGNAEQLAYQAGGYAVCEALYRGASEHDEPLFAYAHEDEVIEGDGCGWGSSAIGGLAFYPGGAYPDRYRGALFFADYGRGCIWSIPAGADGVPDPAQRQVFLSGAPGPVDLKIGPGGDLYYLALTSGELRRIEHTGRGPVPAEVAGVADVATAAAGPTSGNRPPRPIIDTPVSLPWRVGDVIEFSGRAVDPEEGELAPAALSWSVVLQHCPSDCHTHFLKQVSGASTGSFVAIDHEYPSHIELVLQATDREGLTGGITLLLRPQTTELVVGSEPEGLTVSLNATAAPAPLRRTVIVGSSSSLGAPVQDRGGARYAFERWSDGGRDPNRIVVATPGAATLVARFVVAAAAD